MSLNFDRIDRAVDEIRKATNLIVDRDDIFTGRLQNRIMQGRVELVASLRDLKEQATDARIAEIVEAEKLHTTPVEGCACEMCKPKPA